MIRLFFKELFKMVRQLRSWLGPLSVFVLILVAFPLTQDIDTKFSHQTTFSFLWIISLLVIMLSTEKVFLEDFDDGLLWISTFLNPIILVIMFLQKSPLLFS